MVIVRINNGVRQSCMVYNVINGLIGLTCIRRDRDPNDRKTFLVVRDCSKGRGRRQRPRPRQSTGRRTADSTTGSVPRGLRPTCFGVSVDRETRRYMPPPPPPPMRYCCFGGFVARPPAEAALGAVVVRCRRLSSSGRTADDGGGPDRAIRST